MDAQKNQKKRPALGIEPRRGRRLYMLQMLVLCFVAHAALIIQNCSIMAQLSASLDSSMYLHSEVGAILTLGEAVMAVQDERSMMITHMFSDGDHADKDTFRIYYNQATAHLLHHLSLVNWWSGRLYKSPVLPPADKVYCDFKGRVLKVPVLHAPPWHFVKYNNDSSVNVTGGRDEKLLSLIAKKLNFRYEYYDPPERSQGSGISGNGTLKGTLGQIWKRKADFFLGDVSVTWEGLQAVEFSFLTLADSGAFLTHAPAKLSETLAIIRPFQWEVWPLVAATLLMTGPALWAVIAAPSLWQKGHKNQLALFYNCCWFTTSLFLRQSSSKEPSSTHKARLVAVLISLGATYVIGDMYSANLTSLLARPAREPPIGTLPALEEAMKNRGYELVVERHSASLAILQNGTGVYGRLARLMKRQRVQRVRSIEVGVRLVLARRRVAVLGGGRRCTMTPSGSVRPERGGNAERSCGLCRSIGAELDSGVEQDSNTERRCDGAELDIGVERDRKTERRCGGAELDSGAERDSNTERRCGGSELDSGAKRDSNTERRCGGADLDSGVERYSNMERVAEARS
ncbi:hypothetical protein MSG28_007851 [Choristoneura fumiferana]|uniref:Uncharacterized protein n=1 Tax=Choristoneura fumiferana TaxID=7141 RepID=A0ACC0J903_CHOFU|nr:hypothetical protein MSG28_007851 [Choristoneura fumiferana]